MKKDLSKNLKTQGRDNPSTEGKISTAELIKNMEEFSFIFLNSKDED